MKKLGISFFLVLTLSNYVLAHEGHGVPGASQTPHGGVVQGNTELFFELVNEAGGIKLYPLTHDMAPIALADVVIDGSAQAPKKSKQPIKFADVEDHFEAKVDEKGAYRYILEITTKYKGKKGKVTFQVEPQN